MFVIVFLDLMASANPFPQNSVLKRGRGGRGVQGGNSAAPERSAGAKRRRQIPSKVFHKTGSHLVVNILKNKTGCYDPVLFLTDGSRAITPYRPLREPFIFLTFRHN